MNNIFSILFLGIKKSIVMVMNFKSKILIISLLLILALSISAVCAGENTSDVQSTVEQNTSAVPATDESGGIDSSNSNYDSGNDVIGADSSKEELGATYTFKNLNLAVSTGSTNIQFGTSYVYDSAADTDINVNYGVRISRSGCTIDGKGYTIDGGGKSRIFTIETGVTIKNVVFVNWKNTAVYARGFDGNPTIKIINCTFKNPPASSGPAVAADHCSFVMDKCTFKDIESWNLNIVELTKLTFEVKNCKFEATRLSSFIAVGGAGNANRPTSGTLYNNTFTYSGPAYYGRPGVSLSNIYIDIEVNVTGCKFNNVDLGVGSKDYTYHEGPDTDALVNVDGCTFDMGRVTCNNHTEVNIHNSIIANNTYSAVEYTKNSKGVIDNCTFINNRKNTGNGAAVLSDANNVTLDIVNSRFINNTADLGGAIYIGEFSTATESNNTYINNIARGGGNSQNFRKSAQNQNIIYVGVGVNGTGSSLDDLANITFAVDDIKENGIIYFTNGTYGDVRCVRSSFKMLPYEGHTPYLTYVNARYSLGGRWLSNIEINNFSFKSTELCASLGESCKLLNCNFTNLNTTYGVSCDGANCIISNCTFINNNFSDGYYGGLIDVCNENVTISNCIFYNNTVYREL